MKAAAERTEAQYIVLDVAVPGRAPEQAGVILFDPETDRAHVKLRRDWDRIAEKDQLEFLSFLEQDLQAKADEMPAGELAQWLADSQSNFLRVSEPVACTIAGSPDLTLRDLYRQNVRPVVQPYKTHVPVYSLRAAAGKFGEDQAVSQEDWIEVEDDHLDERYFAAHVTGRSMEPKIPDGSLCLFRANPVGSRRNKIVLVQREGDLGGEVTIKKYQSDGKYFDDDYTRSRVTMVPLNPDLEPWELQPTEDAAQYRVLAEFIRVLE